MIKTSWLLPLFLLLALPCLAQEKPGWEIFGGYTFQRSNVREYFKPNPSLYSLTNSEANLNGWNVAATEDINSWFGGTLDVSGVYKGTSLLGTSTNQQMYTFMYGPRIFHRFSWGTAFGHVVAGGSQANVSVPSPGPHASTLSFAMAPAVGLDLKFGSKTAIRAVQVEYLHANALGNGQNNNLRVSAGVMLYLPPTRH